MGASKLPPLDFKQDIEQFEAHEEKQSLNFPHCQHKNTQIINGRLQCRCGASWTDHLGNLMQLKSLLDAR